MPAEPRADWTTSTLGERLLHVCELRGWGLNELGREAGILSGTMSRLSRKEDTIAGDPESLVKIADAAKVSHRWLTDGKGFPEADPAVTLGERKDWPALVAAAKRLYSTIPEAGYVLAARAAAPLDEEVDAELVATLARAFLDARDRRLAAAPLPVAAPRKDGTNGP